MKQTLFPQDRTINVEDFYQYKEPEINKRTRKRLTQIKEMGLEECGVAQFGYPDVTSGLYIERIWRLDDKKWNDHIQWIKDKVKEKTGKEI